MAIVLSVVLLQEPAAGSWRSGSGPKIELPFAGATVDEVAIGALNDTNFETRYVRGSLPLRIHGAAANWSAIERWSSKVQFSELFGKNRRQARWAGGGNQFGILARSTTVEDYLAEMGTEDAAGREGLLFDRGLGEKRDWAIPPIFARTGLNDTVVSVGAAGQGLPFHNHASAWQTIVVGRKVFLLLPPLSTNTSESWLRPEPWFEEILSTLFLPSSMQFLRQHADDAWRMVPEAARALRVVVLGPGDTLFIPCNWYHATINLDDTVAVGAQANMESGLGRCHADVYGAASKAYSSSVSALKRAQELANERSGNDKLIEELFTQATELGEQACKINTFNFACSSHLAALHAPRLKQPVGTVAAKANALNSYVGIALIFAYTSGHSIQASHRKRLIGSQPHNP